MIYLLILLAIISCKAPNLGHRTGESKYFPENSLEQLNNSLLYLEHLPHFRYWEFDVRETIDSVLIVFHDESLKRMTGIKGKVSKTKYAELPLLWGIYKIPTLQEVLDQLHNRATKPIMVEIKRIKTKEAKHNLINMVDKLRDNHNIYYLAFKKNFKRSFKNRKYWCPLLKVVKQARKHKKNLCQNYK